MNMPAESIDTRMSLSELLAGIADAPDIPVTGIACDSRKLDSGFVFLACAGASSHGIDFCEAAVKAGVVAIVYDATTVAAVPKHVDVPLVAVDRLAGRLGEIANRFFDSPSSQLRVAGVTGTNGKTTVAWLIAQCLEQLGQSAGYTGTLGYGVGEVVHDDDMTSPDVIEIHRRLAAFRDVGATHAALEVSSHALDQARIDGVAFDATLFTNLSRDHLDYHGSMQAYGEAKARLFLEHPARRRIINLDTEFGTALALRCRDDVTTVSTRFDRVANGRPFVFVRSVVARASGSDIRIESSWGTATFFMPLVGDFNVANAVLVLAYLLWLDIELDDACTALESVSAPPGRMQQVTSAAGPAVFIDYAHSPNALEVALRALGAHTRGKLWCVFGAGGDRDPGKRPLMGRIAERLADRVVITSDNPRSEPPADIIRDIAAGVQAPDAITAIEDRAAAIAWAITNAGDRDSVLIAGKGHEDYQVVGDERLQFSDYCAAIANLESRDAEANE